MSSVPFHAIPRNVIVSEYFCATSETIGACELHVEQVGAQNHIATGRVA